MASNRICPVKTIHKLCLVWLQFSLQPLVTAQDNSDQAALNSLVYFNRPLGVNMEGKSVPERQQALEQGYQSISNLNEKLVRMFELKVSGTQDPNDIASILYALRNRTDLTADQVQRLTAPLQSIPYQTDISSHFRNNLTWGILHLLRNYPGEVNRLLARQLLLHSDLTTVVKAMELLSFIGNLDDLAAVYAIIEKRQEETAGVYYDLHREEMIKKYNDFARRLSKPTLKESYILTPEEIQQLVKAPKDQQDALIRTLVSEGKGPPTQLTFVEAKSETESKITPPNAVVASTNLHHAATAHLTTDSNFQSVVVVAVSIAFIALVFLVVRDRIRSKSASKP